MYIYIYMYVYIIIYTYHTDVQMFTSSCDASTLGATARSVTNDLPVSHSAAGWHQ